MADILGLRSYAVISEQESDAEVELCLEAAMEYAEGAGVPEPETPSALYDMLVYRIATFYHDNRSFPSGSDADYVGINGLILQLRDG